MKLLWYDTLPDERRKMEDKVLMPQKKRIALIAHDNKKQDLIDWVKFNKGNLSRHILFATGITGKMIQHETGLDIHCFKSGPLGGDQQIGARIVEGELDLLIFFWDPLLAQPHDPDVKALLRISVLFNVPTACNRSTADFLFSSPLMFDDYERTLTDYSKKFITP